MGWAFWKIMISLLNIYTVLAYHAQGCEKGLKTFEVDDWVVKVSSQSRDILCKKNHP